MTTEDLVSVILPTYNRSQFITRAIESLRNQTYQNWELIIIDDNSTDETFSVVRKYVNSDHRISYEKLDLNSGASIARNKGIFRAKGEFITFIDSDDEFRPNKIEAQLEVFRSDSIGDLGVVSCGARDLLNGKVYNLRLPIRRSNYYLSLLARKKKIGAGTPFLMVKTKAIKDKNIQFDPELKVMEDWDFVLQIVKYYRFEFVNDYLVDVNHHDKKRLYTSDKVPLALEIQYSKYKNTLIEHPRIHKRFLYHASILIAHHLSVKDSIHFLNERLDDFKNKSDIIIMEFFKLNLQAFKFRIWRLFYLKYLK